MADYNVNMKQWNGTSFDNVLPLAYNAKQLEGQSLAEVKQWVKDNGLLLYTGQYVGTGTYGQSNPTVLTFPFEPIIWFPSIYQLNIQPYYMLCALMTNSWSEMRPMYDISSNCYVSMSADRKSILIYSSYKSNNQLNISGKTYYFAAIGGYDMGGQTEWTITQSGTWTVPRTGRYYIELYGGGGGAWNNPYQYQIAYQAGSSCQSYDSVVLTKGEEIAVTIGTGGGASNNSSPAPNPSAATGTTFGSYNVTGGGMAIGNVGAGAGNLGTQGTAYTRGYNNSTGVLGNKYGYGGWYYGGSGGGAYAGGPGAVYLKYLGA